MSKPAPYSPAVLSAPCHKCGAAPGEKCTYKRGGKNVEKKTPHEERVQASPPALRAPVVKGCGCDACRTGNACARLW